jgi:hypothetical protein
MTSPAIVLHTPDLTKLRELEGLRICSIRPRWGAAGSFWWTFLSAQGHLDSPDDFPTKEECEKDAVRQFLHRQAA